MTIDFTQSLNFPCDFGVSLSVFNKHGWWLGNGFHNNWMVEMRQSHSDTVIHIDSDDCVDFHSPIGPFAHHTIQVDGDACIAQQSRLAITVRTADCLPIIILSGRMIAVIHAGRQGTLQGIARTTALQLRDNYGCHQVTAWFGPCLCTCCHEVHADTQTHYDLIHANSDQLREVFTNDDCNIMHANVCTKCNSNDWFSYRAGDGVGRNYFLIAAK